MEYLSKVLIKSLQSLAEKGILECGISAGHIVSLREKGFIEVGKIPNLGDGYVVSERGRKLLEEIIQSPNFQK